ncbi:hypothetical protein [Psychrobacillus psychrotolerans]|uniref:hypothetical protein n=1 Tax=Psychrobacillus psychrotolerans TaxID=126156 RepID=UPI0015876A72|nr:hypothetical protein [Psychrobacillus psychrotolerans]
MIEVKCGDSNGMSETDELSQRRVATVIAHRSLRGKRPHVTEISSINRLAAHCICHSI